MILETAFKTGLVQSFSSGYWLSYFPEDVLHAWEGKNASILQDSIF